MFGFEGGSVVVMYNKERMRVYIYGEVERRGKEERRWTVRWVRRITEEVN
jgi:hypothetical protein